MDLSDLLPANGNRTNAFKPLAMMKTVNAAHPGKLRLIYLTIAGAICILGFILMGLMGGAFYREFPVEDYLVFHLITEFVSVIVSFAVFTIGWYGYKQRPDTRNLAIALTFFAVGLIDFIHALSYEGMPDFFSENSTSKAATYWITARLIFSGGLLAIVFIPAKPPPRWLHPRMLLACVSALVLTLVMAESYAPGILLAMYVEGEGITPVKNMLEYVVIGLSAVTIAILWKRPIFGRRSTIFLQTALLVGIFSELAFTLYASAYDSYNLLGHVYKVVAYYLILRAIFVSSLQRPYFELSQAREDLERSFDRIGQALSSSLDLEKTLNLITELASDVLGSPYAMVALKQHDSDTLEVHAARGVTVTPTEVPMEDCIAARVWHDQKPTWIEDMTARHYLCHPEIPDGTARSAVAAPILKDSAILGVIAVYSEKTAAFKQPEANLLAAFARHAAVAIENANLFESQIAVRSKIQNYAIQLGILHNLGLTLNRETDRARLLETILKGAAELTSASVGIMVLYQDGKSILGPVYYAPWYTERCALGMDAGDIHDRISRLAATAEKDTIRITDVRSGDFTFSFPAGHLQLRGLLLGTVRATRGLIKGNIILSDKAGGANFTPEDEEIISLLAAQGSVALTSAENFEREHYVAETLQTSLLPSAPVREDMEVGLLYRSAGVEGRVGGDFYDFIELGKNRIAIAVGDVCGKGLEAATYTAMIKYMLRAYLEEGLFPGDCLTRLNRSVHRELSLDKFVTVGLALIDTSKGTVTYSSAGHPPPLICHDNAANPLHLPNSIPLGVLQNSTYLSSQIAPIGECALVIYTDGLIEARPEGSAPMGQERLSSALGRICDLPAQKLVEELLNAATEYAGGSLKDDVALLAVKLPPLT